MQDVLLEKVSHIEELLMKMNDKIDNFLGFEDVTEEERKEIAEYRNEIHRGESLTFDDVFGA